jgi:cytochrome bd ubiquinol oxidase subunit II
MTIDLPFVWAGLIAFAVLAYVVLDGFDLGIGILFPLLGRTRERDLAMASVAPIWDGNETWLVLGGGGLLAVFPLAYSIILTALYAPITAMLLGLVLRGVAFEFRFKTERGKFLWDWAFTAGSLVAAMAQGIMLGALVQGIKVSGRAYAGGWFDWLTPFSLLTAGAVVAGYALLGATWLIWKTDGPLQATAHALARPLALILFAAIALVSLWTPLLNPRFLQRWFSRPAIVYVLPVPILTAFAGAYLLQALDTKREWAPFACTLILFFLSYIGLGISLYPMIVPPNVTIWSAAAPDESLRFLLVGAIVLIPLIVLYTGYSYWVFRGKAQHHDAYH